MPVVPTRGDRPTCLRAPLRRGGHQRGERPDDGGRPGGGRGAPLAADRADVGEDGGDGGRRRAVRHVVGHDRAHHRARRAPSRPLPGSGGDQPVPATGWNSVLFDGSKLSVEENARQSIEVVEEAKRYGALVEGEIEGFKRVEDVDGEAGSDRRASRSRLRSTSSGRPASTCSRRRSAMRTGCTERRPARQPTGDRHRRGDRHPGRAARRHGHDAGAVHRPDRARLREGQHLDRAQDQASCSPATTT